MAMSRREFFTRRPRQVNMPARTFLGLGELGPVWPRIVSPASNKPWRLFEYLLDGVVCANRWLEFHRNNRRQSFEADGTANPGPWSSQLRIRSTWNRTPIPLDALWRISCPGGLLLPEFVSRAALGQRVRE
jgi:hypothetical protein